MKEFNEHTTPKEIKEHFSFDYMTNQVVFLENFKHHVQPYVSGCKTKLNRGYYSVFTIVDNEFIIKTDYPNIPIKRRILFVYVKGIDYDSYTCKNGLKVYYDPKERKKTTENLYEILIDLQGETNVAERLFHSGDFDEFVGAYGLHYHEHSGLDEDQLIIEANEYLEKEIKEFKEEEE